MTNRSERSAVVLTLLATFFWGSNFQATKIALETVQPWTASVERFTIAVIGIFAILLAREGLRFSVLSRNFSAYLTLGIIGVAGFNGSLFVGLQTSSPVTAALIMATTPISANIIEALLNRRAPGRDRIVGMIVSLVGVSVVITHGRVLSSDIQLAPGDVIIFLGSLGWAAYTVGTRAFVRDATPLETTSWTMLFGTIALTLAAFVFENPPEAIFQTSYVSLAALVWMGVAGSILAYLFWNVGIAVRGPGKTSIFFNFVPIFALIIAAVMGVAPQGIQIVGVVSTICGVLVGQGRFSGLFQSKVSKAQ